MSLTAYLIRRAIERARSIIRSVAEDLRDLFFDDAFEEISRIKPRAVGPPGFSPVTSDRNEGRSVTATDRGKRRERDPVSFPITETTDLGTSG